MRWEKGGFIDNVDELYGCINRKKTERRIMTAEGKVDTNKLIEILI